MVSKDEENGSGVQSPDLGSLVARLNTPAPEEKPEPKKKREPWSREKKRSVLFTSLRWTGVATALIGAIVMFSASGAIHSANDEEIAHNATKIRAEQERLDTAVYAKEDLPEDTEAKRSIGRAEEAASSVATYQNTYLENTGSLSLKGIPTTDKDDPDKTPGTRVREYTEKERQALAQERRDAQVGEAQRSLVPYFDASSRDSKGVNATEPWYEFVSTVETKGGTVSLAQYRWSTPAIQAFSPDGSVEVLWLLTEQGEDADAEDALAPDAQPLGWVRATYNPITSTFEHLSVGTYEKEGS